MLKNITKILLYCYVENHFYPCFISFKKEKKNIYIKTKENMQQNTEFPRTCGLRHSWRFVRREQGGGLVCGLYNLYNVA